MKSSDPNRSFGLTVGGAFSVLALVLAWRGRMTGATVSGAIGVSLVAGGLLLPSLLRVPRRLWGYVGHFLGWVNTRVILTLAFAIVLTPVGFFWRLVGSDPLARRRDRRPGWSPYPARYRDKKHYARMY